jgi:hypothetical protein
MAPPERPADAIVLGGPSDGEFWKRHPDLEDLAHVTAVDRVEEWSLWFADPPNVGEMALTKWLGERPPGRAADLLFENAGHCPAHWIWQRHPDVTGFVIEYDPGDGVNWWASIWTGEV